MRTIVTRLIAAALCAVTASIGAASAQVESTFDKIKRTGIFLAGVRYDLPPLGSVDTAGNPVGFSIDLSRLIAQRMGVKVELVQITSQTRMPMLQSGRIDADVGPATPSKRREEVVDFTIPYVWDGVTIVIRRGSSTNIKDYGPPRKLSTTQGNFVLELMKDEVPNGEYVLFQEHTDAIVALLNGKVDGVGMNRFNGEVFVKQHPQQLALADDFFVDPWAIMVRQNDSRWRNFLNWTLQELWHEGIYQQIYARHFGAPPRFHMWSEFRLQPGIGK
jgi:polar amino acid transport system substrate-binding protein